MPDFKIIRFDSLPSTQDYAVELARNARELDWTVVAAGAQTKGRGVSGNIWYSPAGQNLYFSLIAWPPEDIAEPAALNHVAALGIVETLADYGVSCKIKWPNDVLAGGKKICGILSTWGKNSRGAGFVVCGVGLNVDTEDFPPELTGRATSVKLTTGKSPNKEELLGKLLATLKRRFLFFFSNGFAGEVREYSLLMAQIGEAYPAGSDSPRGTIAGISEKGWLLVKYPGGVEAVKPYG